MAKSSFQKWRSSVEPWYAAIGIANLTMGTSSVLIPLLLTRVLHESVGALGVLSTFASLAGVIGSLVWGTLSDAAHRRKPFVVLSFGVLCISFLGVASSHSLFSLLVHNVMLNFFWIANASVTVLLVIENQEESLWETKISRLNQAGSFGWLLGLALGGIGLAVASRFTTEAQGIRTLFVVVAAGAAIAAVLGSWLIPATRPRFTRRRFRGIVVALGNFLVETGRFRPFHLYHRFNPLRLPSLLKGKEGLRPETKRFLFATLLTFTALGFFGVPLPLLLSERLGFPSPTVFLYYVVLHTSIVLAYPWASRRIRQVGNKVVHIGSLLVRVMLFLLAAVFLILSPGKPPAYALVIFFLLIGITWSFFQLSGVALASRIAKPKYRGQALGLYNSAAGLGTIIAGVASGFMAEKVGYHATFVSAAFLLLLSILVLVRLPSSLPQEKRTKTAAPRADDAPGSVRESCVNDA